MCVSTFHFNKITVDVFPIKKKIVNFINCRPLTIYLWKVNEEHVFVDFVARFATRLFISLFL